MGQNLKAFLKESASYSATDLVQILADVTPGRSVEDRYVVSTVIISSNSFVMELDDGSQFKMTCEKLI